MLTTTVRGKAPAILGTACAVLMASGGLAVAQDDQRRLDRSTEKIDFEGPLPDRPKLVGDSLVWDNHALSELCTELGGAFRKLAGRGDYKCRLTSCSR